MTGIHFHPSWISGSPHPLFSSYWTCDLWGWTDGCWPHGRRRATPCCSSGQPFWLLQRRVSNGCQLALLCVSNIINLPPDNSKASSVNVVVRKYNHNKVNNIIKTMATTVHHREDIWSEDSSLNGGSTAMLKILKLKRIKILSLPLSKNIEMFFLQSLNIIGGEFRIPTTAKHNTLSGVSVHWPANSGSGRKHSAAYCVSCSPMSVCSLTGLTVRDGCVSEDDQRFLCDLLINPRKLTHTDKKSIQPHWNNFSF